MAQRLFVAGHPIAHSKSPAMHNAAYRALGLDWEYGFADCPDEDAARALFAAGDWLACNITMPWKPLAYSLAGVHSLEADLAQGANVLVRHEGVLYADNTDGIGCVSYLERCGVAFAGARVSICGTGPTALAIMRIVGASRSALRAAMSLLFCGNRERKSPLSFGPARMTMPVWRRSAMRM